MSLAETVLDACPARMGSLTFQRNADGSASVVGETPEYLAISIAALYALDGITWETDRLKFDLTPEPVYYQPIFADLFRADAAIVCRLVSSAEPVKASE